MPRLAAAALHCAALLACAVTGGLGVASAAVPAQDWRFEQALSTALATHPAVLGKRASVDAATADLDEARWQRYPSPSFETNQYASGGLTNMFRLEQPLWTGGRISAGITGAEHRVDAADAAVLEMRQDIALRVIAAWTDACRQEARVTHARRAVQEHEKLLGLISRRVDNEVSPPVDRDFARSRLLQAQNDLASVTQARNAALSQLSQLVGEDVQQAAVLPQVDPGEPDRELLLQRALEHAPSLQRLRAEEGAAEADVNLNRASLLPRVGVRLERTTGPLADTRALLVVSVRPGAGLSASAAVHAARSRRDATHLARDAAQRDLQAQIAVDWDDWQFAKQRLQTAQQSRAMSAEVFESYTRQYTTGRKTWIDVLNAVREVTQADFQMADAQAQVVAAALRLRLRSGALDVENPPTSSDAGP
jgi:adhesin transport system outer membrane protein